MVALISDGRSDEFATDLTAGLERALADFCGEDPTGAIEKTTPLQQLVKRRREEEGAAEGAPAGARPRRTAAGAAGDGARAAAAAPAQAAAAAAPAEANEDEAEAEAEEAEAEAPAVAAEAAERRGRGRPAGARNKAKEVKDAPNKAASGAARSHPCPAHTLANHTLLHHRIILSTPAQPRLNLGSTPAPAGPKKLTPEQAKMIKEHPALSAANAALSKKVEALTRENCCAVARVVAAEAKAKKYEDDFNALKVSKDKDVEIAVLKAKMQGGLLMLQRAEAMTSGRDALGAAEAATPGAGPSVGPAVPTPTALEQFFAN